MSPFFKQIVGHQKQLEMLREDLNKNKLAHAYLLAGPADLGKFTIAKAMAKAIQTHQLDEDKAHHVISQIDRGIHPDTIFWPIDPGEESIKIMEVRGILNNLQMTGDSARRILVLEELDKMTPEAANAMLKMIEEPPAKVLYIFTSSNPKGILETILSRVRRLDFQLSSNRDLFQILKTRYRLEEESHLFRVAELAQGRIAKAIKLLDNREHLEVYEQTYKEIADFLTDRNVAEAFGFIAQIHTDPLLIQIFLEIAFIVLSENLRKATSEGVGDKAERALNNLEKLFEVKRLSETNVNSRLLLENFILSL